MVKRRTAENFIDPRWASTDIHLREVDGRLGFRGPRTDRVKLLMSTIAGCRGGEPGDPRWIVAAVG